MTKEEFEQGYAERSGMTVMQFRELGHAEPCDCGELGCNGWQYVTRQKHHPPLKLGDCDHGLWVATGQMKPVTDENTCITGGPIGSNTFGHVSCPVELNGVVCACECIDCKRPWFKAGRPKTGDKKLHE